MPSRAREELVERNTWRLERAWLLRKSKSSTICMDEEGGDPRTELSGPATFTNRGEESMPSALSGPEGGESPGGFIVMKVEARDCSKTGEWWPGSKAESKEGKVPRG